MEDGGWKLEIGDWRLEIGGLGVVARLSVACAHAGRAHTEQWHRKKGRRLQVIKYVSLWREIMREE